MWIIDVTKDFTFIKERMYTPWKEVDDDLFSQDVCIICYFMPSVLICIAQVKLSKWIPILNLKFSQSTDSEVIVTILYL